MKSFNEFIKESSDVVSPNFKKWFGRSEVVDGSGKPLVVYHESKSDDPFTVFDQDELGNRATFLDAYYFSNDKSWGGNHSMAVYIKLLHPIEVDISSTRWTTLNLQELIDAALRGEENIISKYARDNKFKVNDIDGYIAYNPEWGNRGTVEYAVLKSKHDQSSRIKSATDNNGDFNPRNPDITK